MTAGGTVQLSKVTRIRPRGTTLDEEADASPIDLLERLKPGYFDPASAEGSGLVNV